MLFEMEVLPLELYIHLPFCRSKCLYCDFASWAGQEAHMDAYVDDVLLEAQARAEELGAIAPMSTAFLGGGTPSILPAPLLQKLLEGVQALFPLAQGAEFTSEANPGTITAEWLDIAVACGVNRLSLGMQALQPELLRTLGRIHDFRQVEQAVRMAREAGLQNISLDLMFGLPGQTLAMWQETLAAALSLHPQHLSCYGLIPEEGTPLMNQLASGTLKLPEEDVERQMYDNCLKILQAHGMEQYEISNFALPGRACQHNLGYWRQIPYLGLGASAASMLPCSGPETAYTRQTNPRSIASYRAMIRAESWQQRDVERVSPAEARFETMMLGLRTTAGVSEKEFERMHGRVLQACYGSRLAALQNRGLLEHADGRWFLTRRGMDIQNSVLVELMDD